MTIFWILVPIFLAVGLYLVWYSRRTRRMISDFASAKNLTYHGGDDGQLAAVLDEALRFERPGVVRSFGQIRDIVYDDDTVVLFRTVELLDLSPYGSSQSTHQGRVAATFEVSDRHDLFVLVHPDLQCQSRVGSESAIPEEDVATIRGALEKRPPRCPLSVTLKRGRGLVYLEPRVTGNVKPEDLNYLIATGRDLRAVFT
jgi:hypothetical protein